MKMYLCDRTLKLSATIDKLIPHDMSNVVFICIGTDRSTGDSFGPIVGSLLKEYGLTNIEGTLHQPVHAMNLKETVERHKDKFIFAIDACLGRSDSVGKISATNKPIRPGAGVNKDLGEVGDASLTAVVNVGGFMEYFVLQNTRLSTVMDLAQTASNAIIHVMENRLPVCEVAAL
ncbi:hypothetical protein D3C71_1129530 [compost metagenome]